jgi:hypothetical protein
MHTGLLPAWFKDEREILPDSDLQQSLSVEDTNAELDKIEAEIEPYFDEAAETALDQASLQMAQVDRLVPKHVPTRPVRQDLVAAMVATVKRDNPGKSIEQVCHILDVKQCPLREVDKRAGFSNWHGAWKDSRNRNRIKRFISQIRPAAAQKKV